MSVTTWQEPIALAAVALSVLWLTRGWYGGPLSRWLLRRGKVKWAMRVRGACGCRD